MPIWIRIIHSLLILFSLVSILNRKSWWIRVFDFPRSQIAVLLIVFFFIALFYSPSYAGLDFILVVLTILSLTVQSIYIFPYLSISPKEVPTADAEQKLDPLRIMVSNVRMKNRDSDKLIEQVNKNHPDIFLTVETNEWWCEQLIVLEKVFPYHVYHPLENTYGMLLYSKIPLKDAEVKFLIKDDIPSIHCWISLNGNKCNLICIHPEPPAPDQASTSKPRDKELFKVAEEIRNEDEAYLVMGDFNDVAWSDTTSKFQKMSKMLDPRKGRGFFNTFNANVPLMRFPLDHFFFTHHFRFYDMKTLPHVGSDHFPIILKLGID